MAHLTENVERDTVGNLPVLMPSIPFICPAPKRTDTCNPWTTRIDDDAGDEAPWVEVAPDGCVTEAGSEVDGVPEQEHHKSSRASARSSKSDVLVNRIISPRHEAWLDIVG